MREEDGLPRPIRGGVEVFEDRSDLDEGDDFDLLAEGTGEGGGQVVDEQVDLGDEDDGERCVEGRERVGEEGGREVPVEDCA